MWSNVGVRFSPDAMVRIASGEIVEAKAIISSIDSASLIIS